MVLIVVILVVLILFGYVLYTGSIKTRTVYGSLSSIEFTLIAVSVDYNDAAKYGEKYFNITSQRIINIINMLIDDGYTVNTFLAMNSFIVQKQIIESNKSDVTIQFKPSSLVILAYTNTPDYIKSREQYRFGIVNKTYTIIYNNENITDEIYLLPGSIDELSPDEDIVLIVITNQSITSRVLKVGIIPCSNKTELINYFNNIIKSEKENSNECAEDPNCIGGCSIPHIEYINDWPVLVSEKTMCCKVIHGINHCIMYASILKTGYKNMVVAIYGSTSMNELKQIMKEILEGINQA